MCMYVDVYIRIYIYTYICILTCLISKSGNNRREQKACPQLLLSSTIFDSVQQWKY